MSMSERWIVIPNWEKLQHYGNRRDPPWFKTYISILHDDAYLNLTGHQRGTLHGLWAIYAASHRQLRDSTTTISRQLNMRVTRATLDALSHAGLIQFSASAPLAARYHDASPRAVARVEESREEPLTPPEVGNKTFFEPTPKPGTRASGTNPRALEQRDREQRQQDLLDEARRVAAGWNGSDSLHFDETLDELEHQHALKLGSLERDRLWEQAFQHRTPVPDEDELF
jgi:hypothetical protein